jgi:hypothetical protein
MFPCLAILGETGFELTFTSSHHENCGISLGRACDHVLYEVSMTWRIDNRENTFL